jgi:hypothetical protein
MVGVCGTFSPVPTWIWQHYFGWISAAQTLYMALIDVARGDVACKAKYHTLEKHTRLGRSTVYGAAALLESTGAVFRFDQGGRHHHGRGAVKWVIAPIPGLTKKEAANYLDFSHAPPVHYTGPVGSSRLDEPPAHTTSSFTKNNITHLAAAEDVVVADPQMKEAEARLKHHHVQHRTIAKIISGGVPAQQIIDTVDNGEAIDAGYRKSGKVPERWTIAGYIVNNWKDCEGPIEQVQRARTKSAIAIERAHRAREHDELEKEINRAFAAMENDRARLAEFTQAVRDWSIESKVRRQSRAEAEYGKPRNLSTDPLGRQYMGLMLQRQMKGK